MQSINIQLHPFDATCVVLYRPKKSLPKKVKFYGIKELPGEAASPRKDAARRLLRACFSRKPFQITGRQVMQNGRTAERQGRGQIAGNGRARGGPSPEPPHSARAVAAGSRIFRRRCPCQPLPRPGAPYSPPHERPHRQASLSGAVTKIKILTKNCCFS